MARERRRHHRDDDHHGGRGDRDELHEEIFEMLLDKVRDDTYPSTTQLDMIESILRDEDVEPYTEALLDKVRGETYPSIDHLNRLMRLA
jgi:ribosomal 50S subunit-associated protein YjgA (DUF615 family)